MTFISNHSRTWLPSSAYFFTVNLLPCDQQLLVEDMKALRVVFCQTRITYPLEVLATVILPDLSHCLL